ncbi:hypothetical protein O9G_005050 [Rozella allomycis CSF55]|uniref:Uncharacterized protein n=1 Tax=Rozella allomycis (strain CSF55) TaxID=988480 RepID=A0A075AMM8_ROZAC|nr:hypothetical protein O9G_005050 [Rozella allomycis CSF55]|eukprot:EPZ30883.1 hypothetical protein O9G_005050 [Rozella allomycis CSF55]
METSDSCKSIDENQPYNPKKLHVDSSSFETFVKECDNDIPKRLLYPPTQKIDVSINQIRQSTDSNNNNDKYYPSKF